MLIYVLRWWPSWISDRHKKHTPCRGPVIHRLTLDPMGKCSNAFFSETTNIIKAKLYMNVHWMVLYKLFVLIYVLRLWPSWISDRHIKHKICRGPSNDHSWAVWFNFLFFMPIENPRWPPPQDID
jgi:hypothetical protein